MTYYADENWDIVNKEREIKGVSSLAKFLPILLFVLLQ